MKIPEIYIPTKLIDEKIIGEIYFSNKDKTIDLANLIKYGAREFIQLEGHPVDLLVLPNHQILSMTCKTKHTPACLTLYDKNFIEIKKIASINNKTIYPTRFDSSEDDKKLFILEQEISRITVTDFQLNFINSKGSIGRGKYQVYILQLKQIPCFS